MPLGAAGNGSRRTCGVGELRLGLSKKWLSLSLAAVVICGLSVIATSAGATNVVPDGGGRPHAGGGGPGGRLEAQATASPPPGYSMLGIDVSSHDHTSGPIDWPAVAASGVKFAYVKASEGTSYVNPYFHGDYNAAKAAGILTGAYAFGRPGLRDPVGEANFFIDHAEWSNDSRTIVPFLDVEWPYSALNMPDNCYGLTQQEMRDWIRAFVSQVRTRIGRVPMIYTATSWWNECTGSDSSFGGYPLDIANYSGSPGTLPSGWTTWTVWQYKPGNPSVLGDYDRDVFNGDYAALTRLAGLDPPPPLTSGPVVQYHSGDGQVDIYANAGGALVERHWRPNAGWSGWANFQGDITGTPVVIANPNNGAIEVYANSGGRVREKYWLNGGWSGWADLGGAIDGDPVVFYNPNNRNIEVYGRSGGRLVEKYWNAATRGWSGWQDLGGNLTDGDPVVLYNPNNRNVEIYGNSNGHLVEKYWNASNGQWIGWLDFGGNVTGEPSVLYNFNNRNIEIYANAGGSLVELYWNAGNGQWSGWQGLGGSLGGDPVAFYNPNNYNIEIYARSSGGRLTEKYWNAATRGWSGWQDLGGNLSWKPAAFYNPGNRNVELYAVGDGALAEKYWRSSDGAWIGWFSLMQ
jgi:GH25 family lysozyme M1 (1,4-beta-N-acetylmuramidase)